ncbi:hypothetical protein Pan181_08830 [Aeoliella mucimassa]|uniref:Uncharacterized protein n=1 Tax=Aeoliella mucimassa TaxID=2527972 RepID=A0A518AJ26_9BACT|nr:hypothetical protein Pan181_08830 [Aeoliella mucimassa]
MVVDCQAPVARVILLGASNLRLISATLIATTRMAFSGPVEIFMANGFGRSYGVRSSIPFRSLPGIDECGLWEAVQRDNSLPTFALITDVGNDLVYGRKPDRVIEWVTNCVARLQAMDARMVTTELPNASIESLGVVRYKFFRRIFSRNATSLWPRCASMPKRRTSGYDNLPSHAIAKC